MPKRLAIVVPCYNEEETVNHFYDKVSEVLAKEDNLAYELIFVNDGSKDKTLDKLKELFDKDNRVKVLDFSRNFGKESALLAGLENVNKSFDYVAVMDVDLQDPPELIPTMLKELAESDYDVIGCRRVNRKGEPPIRSFFARMFYKLINSFIEVEIVDGARDFRMMRMDVVSSVVSLQEKNRFSKGIFPWVGYKTKYLEYENVERVAGETSWSFWGLLKYAINGIIAFTTFPLRVATILGLFVSFIAIAFMCYIFAKAILIGDPVAGYPSLICVISLLGGVQLIVMGILGEYMAKVYTEVKQRPNYIIKKKYRHSFRAER